MDPQVSGETGKSGNLYLLGDDTLQTVAVGIVAFLWLILMLVNLSGRSLQVDELITVERSLSNVIRHDPMHPLTYYKYVRFWTDAVGHTDAAFRASSLLPAAVAIICIATVAAWLLPWPAWFVALILVCFSAELLLYWRMARYFAPAAAGFGIAMVGAIGYLREPGIRWAAVLAVGTVLCFFVDYMAAAGTSLLWMWIVVEAIRRRRFGTLAGIVGLIVCSAVVCRSPVRWAIDGMKCVMSPSVLGYPKVTFLYGVAVALWGLLASECLPPWQPWIAFPTAAAMAVPTVIGARDAWRLGGPWRLVLLAWPFAVAIATAVVLATPGEPPVRISSLALYALPYALVVSALGWQKLWPTKIGKSTAVVVALGYLVALSNYFTMRGFLNPQYALNWQPVAQFIAEHAGRDDFVVTAYDGSFYRYYRGAGRRVCVYNDKMTQEVSQKAISGRHRVWLIARDRGSKEARRLLTWLQQQLREAGAQEKVHRFFPYSPIEAALRRLVQHTQHTSYITVYELWFPDTQS